MIKNKNLKGVKEVKDGKELIHKKSTQKMLEETENENQQIAQKRRFIEHTIRLIKIFRLA